MDFLLVRGKSFSEHFDFKTPSGKALAIPHGFYRLVLERGPVVREYTVGKGLVKNRNQILWNIPAAESNDFEYTTMYYTLYLDDTELARGVLKIQ